MSTVAMLVSGSSILGPTLFLVMVSDMPKIVIGEMTNVKNTSYANDSRFHVHATNINVLKRDLEKISNRMISYCKRNVLILNNNEKTQLLVSPKQPMPAMRANSCIYKVLAPTMPTGC